jgi:hypothetical protein
MRLSLRLIGTLFPIFFCIDPCLSFAVEPGEQPPRDVLRNTQAVEAIIKHALQAQDVVAVRAAVAMSIDALGPWAGNPETATRHYPPIVTASFDHRQAREYWFREIRRGIRSLPWLKNPQGDPRMMQMGLREAAYPLDALARSALLFPELRDELTRHVRTGADWLIRLQLPSGVFPFPIGPALNPRDKVGYQAAGIVKNHPEVVVNDWIADDREEGGLQFDNGLCGRALISAWELTKDERYLNAARKVGNWAMSRALVANWNYNAFSVGLLAQLSTATGEERYVMSAVKKAEVGVLPGQMLSGRWFDPHNASAVYHNILMRDLLELYHALPQKYPLRAAVLDAVKRGLNQAADETLIRGYSGTWTDSFARGLQWIGENKKWRDALNVNLNASGKGAAPSAGFAILAVLEGSIK